MLILLPPSEGKATEGDGPALDLAELSLPEVNGAREAVLESLEALCSGPRERAMEVLGLTPGQADAVDRNLALRASPTLPAARLYTGVLYDNLRLGELLEGPTAARTRESVLVFSGLWGAVGIGDPLPPYRLSMGVKLPPMGALGTFWRSHLADPVAKRAEGRLIVDCRSSTYAAAFKPSGEVADHTASVRVLKETVKGGEVKRSVVSHMAKATRGAIAHTLLSEGRAPETQAELAEALNDLGHTAELTTPAKAGRPSTLDVVIRD
ncbi:peroxide stress protein YaaA [Nocardiopsis chromatogenes]|uniref:peroxide stress protein YaaA n=1 Tax=Nocardiopsis chromatogenes TaxID=280239 RepID=UPI00034BECEA|nr:peroxide stress protein YaaA [Nocardiopsis chromatogenes]